MANDNELKAQVNITSGSSDANLAKTTASVTALDNSIRRMQALLKTPITVAQKTTLNSKIIDAQIKKQTLLQKAEQTTATVTAASNKSQAQTRLLNAQASDVETRTIQRNEKAKTAALKATARAAATDANPGASTALPAQYLARKSVGLATQNLNLPDPAQLSAARQSLYAVSAGAAILGTTLVAAGGSAVVFAAKYETAMATLARTTDLDKTSPKIAELKSQLIDLSETIPESFTDLAGIAALGAQLNIDSDDLAAFSKTVAQYSVVSGVAADTVAQDFGAIGNLLDVSAGQYQNLGSAINYAGIKSVATDTEILNLTTSIAASAKQAGFTAAQTVGLGSALASLRIQPEQARGVILRLFSTFDKTVSQGGAQLDKFAAIVGESSKDTAKLWKQQPEVFFDKLLKGLSSAKDLNGTLRDLGITETRETNVIQRLAGNYNVYADSIDNATKSYDAGSFLGEAFAKSADTVANKLKVLVDTIQNLLAKAGGAFEPVLKPALDILTFIVQSVENLPAPVLGAAAALAVITGGLALLVAAGAGFLIFATSAQRALASFSTVEGESIGITGGLRAALAELSASFGINTVAARVNSATIGSLIGVQVGETAGLRTMATAQFGSSTAFGAMAAGARTAGAALLSIPIVNIVAALSIAVPLVLAAVQGLNDASEASDKLADTMISAGGGIKAFTDTLVPVGTDNSFGNITTSVSEADKALDEAVDKAAKTANAVKTLAGVNNAASSAIDNATGSLLSQNQALSQSSVNWLKNAAVQAADDNGLSDIAGDSDQLQQFEKYGIDLQAAIKKGATSKGGVKKALQDQFKAAGGALGSDDGGFGDWLAKTTTGSIGLQGNLYKIGGAIDSIITKAKISGNVDAIADLTAGASDTETDLGAVATALDAIKTAGTDAKTAVSDMFTGSDAFNSVLSSLGALNDGLEDSGTGFNNLSESGRTNINNLNTYLQSAAAYGHQTGQDISDSVAQALINVDGTAKNTSDLLQQLSSLPAEFRATLNIDDVIAKYNDIASLGVSQQTIQLAQAENGSELTRIAAKRKDLETQITAATQQSGSAAQKNASAADTAAKKAHDDAVKAAAQRKKDAAEAHLDLVEQLRDTNELTTSNEVLNGVKNGSERVRTKTTNKLRTVKDPKTGKKTRYIDTTTVTITKTKKTAEEYAQDLSDAIDGVFTKQFAAQSAANAVTTTFNSIKDAIDEAKDSVAGFQAQVDQLAADKTKLSAQLADAQLYGDTARAADISAQLEQNSVDSKDANGSLANAQQTVNASYGGTDKASIDLTNQVDDLASSYADQIKQMAAAGSTSEELSTKTTELKADFVAQATQLGLTATQAESVATGFDNIKTAIAAVPTTVTTTTTDTKTQNITVNADTEAAKAKIDAIYDKAVDKTSTVTVNATANTATADTNVGNLTKSLKALEAEQVKLMKIQQLLQDASDFEFAAEAAEAHNQSGAGARAAAAKALAAAKKLMGGAAHGGIIGGGGRPVNRGVDDTLMMVQQGEAILTQKTTAAIGSDGINALNNGQNPFYSPTVIQQTGSTAPAVQMVELSAADRQLLDDIRQASRVVLPGTALQNGVSNANVNSSRRRAA